MLKSLLMRSTLAAALIAVPALSFAEIIITDPYARASRPNAPTGAAFMTIENNGETADRLLSARSEVAKRVELHTHIDQGGGVLKMVELEDGIEIPPGSEHLMARGGDHVMFMGLNRSLEQGGEITVILTFEQAGDVTLTVPVDNDRQPAHGAGSHATH